MNKDKNEQSSNMERRRHKRIKRSFILTYFDKANPTQKFEITQLKNISLGGMCFITGKQFSPPAKMRIELKTPFLSDTTFLEGSVLESHEKVKGMIYETRLEFDPLSTEAEFLLSKIIELFINGDKRIYEED